MKKSTVALLFLMGIIFCVSNSMAEESGAPPQDGMEYNMQDAGMVSERGGNDDRKQMMKSGKGGGMMQHNKPTLVATSDGGIVVLDGPRLLKYDSQLNLVGEAELKPGKKGPQMKRDEDKPAAEAAPAMDEPAIDLPAVENPA